MAPTDQLTPRQQDVFDFICDRIQNGYGPTVREIGKAFGISSPNGVMCHLRALERKGLIRRDKMKSRAIELTEEALAEQTGLALAGVVHAGPFHLAIEEECERIDFANMFNRNDLFVLQVSGDSMIDAQIADGDYVVVKKQATARRGQIVVARTEDGDATLKYWFPEDGRIRLQPANDSMEPMYVQHADVVGVVTGLVRQVS
ncbi:MAG: transcriptional repressor LexA [Pirellulaceae bacterium]|jgi:repressor LexA|nr:transcriptional repressor LexA [Pirellulaceae bacterium]MDP7018466.1 transcriptional repressor LexA [Pirellulaceae bacterium]